MGQNAIWCQSSSWFDRGCLSPVSCLYLLSFQMDISSNTRRGYSSHSVQLRQRSRSQGACYSAVYIVHLCVDILGMARFIPVLQHSTQLLSNRVPALWNGGSWGLLPYLSFGVWRQAISYYYFFLYLLWMIRVLSNVTPRYTGIPTIIIYRLKSEQ